MFTFFFRININFKPCSKNRLTVKVILTHNRKLSILHLFALIIQFLSLPLTASFAFSISGVYFLFEDRVTTVIPFVPLLPNSRNKCFFRLGFNKEYFSSFSEHPTRFYLTLSMAELFWIILSQQLNFWTLSEQEYDKDNPRLLSQIETGL